MDKRTKWVIEHIFNKYQNKKLKSIYKKYMKNKKNLKPLSNIYTWGESAPKKYTIIASEKIMFQCEWKHGASFT